MEAGREEGRDDSNCSITRTCFQHSKNRTQALEDKEGERPEVRKQRYDTITCGGTGGKSSKVVELLPI